MPEGDGRVTTLHVAGPRHSLPHGIEKDWTVASKTAWRRRFAVGAMLHARLGPSLLLSAISLVLKGTEVGTAALRAGFAVDVGVDVQLEVGNDVRG